jgi:predicted type IV restriction endonuclease
MAQIPAKVAARFTAGLKRFQPILTSAKARDVNESDTVVIVADMLNEVFGYDKYEEITSEHAIKGTFCDLAIKLSGTLVLLVEIKAVGLDPKEAFIKQAVDYAANQGVDWVVLTNGVSWRIYKVTFAKPIDHELLAEFNFLDLNPKDEDDLCLLWLLAKESWQKEALADYHAQRQALSRFTLGALILSPPILDVLKRELRRVSPDIRIRAEEVENALTAEVLKREILEGEKADAAKKLVAKAAKVQLGQELTNRKSRNPRSRQLSHLRSICRQPPWSAIA